MTLKLKLFIAIVIVIAVLSGATLGYLTGKQLFHVEEKHVAHETEVQISTTASLQLSELGWKNIGLQVVAVEQRDFDRTINVPAIIKSRPGQTTIQVAAPMTGIVTQIYPLQGEVVLAGEPLFTLRLTHKDLVDTQSKFLETIEQLDVIKQEVTRLEAITANGITSGKQLLERQYAQQQMEASLHAQKQALILHGLTAEQVANITTTRRLLQEVTIVASGISEFKVEVDLGQYVQVGDLLCVLNDYAMLYIEGQSFEEDSEELNQAILQGWPVTAVIEANDKSYRIPNLKMLYLENEIDLVSRALQFYVCLPNERIRDEQTDGHYFIGWRFKPGQRIQVQVPVERWENQIVVPVDAVIQEGVEWFIFCQNGSQFDRKSVHVKYRDQWWVVIENDGILFPGDIVAISGVYQMYMAIKNQSEVVADAHAGHNH